LQRDKDKENPLGNLIADCIRNYTLADIGIVNFGLLRSIWFPGDILYENILNMFPFNNKLVTVQMTGKEVRKMMEILQEGSKGFYSTSGVKQIVTKLPVRKLESLKFYDNTDIVDDQIYSIATNDFLIGGGDDFKNVLTWYIPRNYIDHGIFRDKVLDYLKKIKYIKENDLIDPLNPRLKIIDQNDKITNFLE